MSTTALRAIQTSIRENRIVTLTYAELGSEYIPVRDCLSQESDDTTVNGDVTEYWGMDEDDDEWCVHVAGP